MRENIVPVADFSDREDDEEQELRRRSKRTKRIRKTIFLIILILLAAGAAGIYLFRRFYRYSSYDVAWEKDLSQGSLVGYEQFGKGLLKYSRDGVTYLSPKGEETWVESYEMKNPVISVNGKYAAIADQQGNALYIFNEDGKTGSATTLLPVTKVAVSNTGTAAVIEEDAAGSYITFFGKDGAAIDITIKTKLSGDGYPTDIALSPDGTRLMVSYEYLNGQNLKGRVVFYDFSEIGKSIPNRLVGGFDEPFANSLVAEVGYLDSTYSFAAADSGLCFFSSKNLTSPEMTKEIPETDEIQNLFYSKDCVGVILKETGTASRYRLEVYRPNGNLLLKKEFNNLFQYAGEDGGYIFIYSSDSLLIFNMSGTEKFNGSIDFPIARVIKGPMPKEFLLAGPTAMKSIRLK